MNRAGDLADEMWVLFTEPLASCAGSCQDAALPSQNKRETHLVGTAEWTATQVPIRWESRRMPNRILLSPNKCLRSQEPALSNSQVKRENRKIAYDLESEQTCDN